MNLFLPTLCLLSISITHSEQLCEEKKYVSYNGHYNERKSWLNGDYIYEVLMTFTNGNECNEVTGSGLLKILATKYSLKIMNEEVFSLMNITIGYRFNDVCLSLPIGMYNGIQIVQQFRDKQCHDKNSKLCGIVKYDTPNVVGIIGAYYSFTTLPLANLFGLHNIPIISSDASIPRLSKKSVYKSFFRTISPDTYNIQAIIDIVKYFNWTYIFIVGSDDDYGKTGLMEIKKLAFTNNICITGEAYLPLNTIDTQKVAFEIGQHIQYHSKAAVVIMFNYPLGNGQYLIEEVEKLKLNKIWLTGEAWNPEVLSIDSLPESHLQSIFTVSLRYGKPTKKFIQFINDSIDNDFKCNIWLNDYIKQNFYCSVNNSNRYFLFGYNCNGGNCQYCNVSKRTLLEKILSENPNQINNLIDAIYAMSYSLNTTIKSACSNHHSCKPNVNMANLVEELKKIRFINERNEEFYFNEDGDPGHTSYSIEQIQKKVDKLQYVPIGKWSKTKSLFINDSLIKWPHWASFKKPRSTCSDDCQPGTFRGTQECCWACQPCPDNTYSKEWNADVCQPCPEDYYSESGTSCHTISITYLKYSDTMSVIGLSISAFGILLSLFIILTYYLFLNNGNLERNSMVVSMSIFILLIVTFIYPIFHILEPTPTICMIQDVYFHMIITVYNTMLLIINNSVENYIEKLFHRVKINGVAITFFIAVVEVSLLLPHLLLETEKIEIDIPNRKEYHIKCEHDFSEYRVIAYILPTLILVIGTIQSYIERKPFSVSNRAGFLTSACFSITLVNIAYLIAVNNVKGNYQQMVIGITVVLYSFIYIFLIILPDIYCEWKTNVLEIKKVNETGIINIGFDGISAIHDEMKQAPLEKSICTTELKTRL